MIFIYNLTDETPPGESERVARSLKCHGKIIKPGSYETFDSVPLSDISGWIYDQLVSVDFLPEWYCKRKDAVND